ncbi:hypothetical protein FSP39_022831 [Pinctada imbricata]|uniref:Cadherin domain-containing protein n=1 Tax=Pinctada imbricata TaxID=66713 RepID=A0AA88YJU0_PINIB|nr:hypothetical protein FSP39_022831 [Pinctada imbricata]
MAAMKIVLFLCACVFISQTSCQLPQLSASFDLQEELANNTLVGSLITELDLGSKINVSLNEVAFNFLQQSGAEYELFRVEQTTSKIFTKLKIDREAETVCKYKEECVFDFDVAARKAPQYFQIINVRINITDINDNTPFFENSIIQLNISESTTTNQTVLSIDGAMDLDRGKDNSVKSHELVQQNSDFRLQVVKSQFDESEKLNIITNVNLDRERKDFYELKILARDGGNPVRTGTLTIRVNVLDENDNTPQFLTERVSISVNETEPVNKTIYKFTAVDIDAGLNGAVMYKFKTFLTNEAEFRQLFAINNRTGEVYINGKLEYIPDMVYSVIIEAYDQGNNPKSSTARLDVTVKDVGNNQPKITLTFFVNTISSHVAEVDESEPLGFVIAHITVEDTDSGENGQVTCRTYSTYFALQSIADKGYTVIIQHKLDRETADMHNISVTCADKGSPVLDDTVHFTVKVKDSNDNPPKFSEYYYNVNIYENNNIGQSIITVTATDPDEGPNAKITYSMEPITSTRFSIDSNSGLVTSNINFDRELMAHLTFQVRAMDHGNPPKNNTATVVVAIKDVNDNSPTFTKANFLYTISENMPAGEHVGNENLQAVDEDQGKNGEVVYSLPKGFNASSIPFVVLSTGEIKTNRSLDREQMSRYDFPVIATDRGTPSRTGSANVTVQVLDQNDNVPVFIFPNRENSSIHIPNTTPVETIIASIQAYDVDDDSQGNGNGKVMYSITEGNTDGIFYLNHETGSLFYRKAVSFKDRSNKEFLLRISARDNGSPVLESLQSLTVVVHYSNASVAASTSPEESDNKYVLIVVSVVCATFVCSVGLVACIIVLRKRGDLKSKTAGLNTPCNRPPPPLYDAAPPHGNNNNKGYPVPPPPGKQLKNQLTFPGNREFTKAQLMERLTGSPAHMKLSPEESPSETSAETMGTDSGHGGSEEDFANHTHDQRLGSDPRYNYKKDIFVIHENVRNNGVNIPSKVQGQNDPPKYASLYQRGPQSNSKYLDDSFLTSSVNSMWSEQNAGISRQNSNAKTQQTLPTIPAWSSLNRDGGKFSLNDSMIFYKDGTLGSQSAHSREEDDCRSTTTSGSYTINPEDLDEEIGRLRSRDLFV